VRRYARPYADPAGPGLHRGSANERPRPRPAAGERLTGEVAQGLNVTTQVVEMARKKSRPRDRVMRGIRWVGAKARSPRRPHAARAAAMRRVGTLRVAPKGLHPDYDGQHAFTKALALPNPSAGIALLSATMTLPSSFSGSAGLADDSRNGLFGSA